MDLRHLLRRAQGERGHARAAAPLKTRLIHDRLADMFSDRIGGLRRALSRDEGPGPARKPARP